MERNDKGRRFVLGFDAGCMTCSGLAERIEAKFGDKIQIRSLNDPVMAHWRRQVFGENAPWAPTLVEIEHGRVRAWTGVRMAVRLSRILGPVATWRMMQVLGEATTTPRFADSASAVPGLTRGQFLKGVGGAMVAISVLSGTKSLAAPVGTEEHWLARLSFASSKELSEKQAAAAWARLARGRHLRGLLSSVARDDNPAAGRIRGRMLSAPKTGVAKPPEAVIKGVSHQLKGGGRLLALVYQEDDAMMVSYSLDAPGQKTRLLSRVLEDASEETVRVLTEAEDGDVFVDPRIAADLDERAVRCSDRRCRGGCQTCCPCRCVDGSKRCLANCCGACAISCGTLSLWACVGCVLVWCPVCAAINRCCYRRRCRYVLNCGK